jgi:hypothetical protein
VLGAATLAACSTATAHGPVPVRPAGGPSGAVLARCAHLSQLLPAQLNGLPKRPTWPRSELTAAWGNPPVTLQCGVARPAGWGVGVDTLEVSGVDWYQQLSGSRVEWTVVGRDVYVAFTAPTSYQGQGDFLAVLADPVSASDPISTSGPG